MLCRHRQMTFPQTSPVRIGFTSRPTTVCLSCGKEFEYDWKSMRVVYPASWWDRVRAVLRVA